MIEAGDDFGDGNPIVKNRDQDHEMHRSELNKNEVGDNAFSWREGEELVLKMVCAKSGRIELSSP